MVSEHFTIAFVIYKKFPTTNVDVSATSTVLISVTAAIIWLECQIIASVEKYIIFTPIAVSVVAIKYPVSKLVNEPTCATENEAAYLFSSDGV